MKKTHIHANICECRRDKCCYCDIMSFFLRLIIMFGRYGDRINRYILCLYYLFLKFVMISWILLAFAAISSDVPLVNSPPKPQTSTPFSNH